jgi:hypothetical protein
LEIFFTIFIPLVALFVWYMTDRKSFTATFLGKKRPVEPVPHSYEPAAPAPGKAISRADSLAYEHVSDIHEPMAQPPAKVVRHEIIKHDYYHAYSNNRWPQWTCKCGDSGYAITTKYESLEKTEAEARRNGQDHVRKATIIDDRLEKTNGKFAF